MTTTKQWWRRAAAAVKDKRSLYLTILSPPRCGDIYYNSSMEAAVIRATSHDDRRIDYKYAGRVFKWARTSHSHLSPLMYSISRRAERTHSWPVALKCLLLVHGLLLLDSNPYRGRVPFDLSTFRDRTSAQFSSFVHSYFQFLDHRSLFSSSTDTTIDTIANLQTLLDLLIQIRPYGDGMNVGLILEAMDCVVIEIFEVYSGICNGIAAFLVAVLGSSSMKEGEEEWKRKGMKGIRILRKAKEQSLQLSNYFGVCKSLGVLNATEFPAVETIPEEDIDDLERLVVEGIPRSDKSKGNDDDKENKGISDNHENNEKVCKSLVTKEWVVFEDEFAEEEKKQQQHLGDPFLCSGIDRQWGEMVRPNPIWNGNLIELI